jgi:hypothetical protein
VASSHLSFQNENKRRQTDGPWMDVNVHVGDLVASWAERTDLITYMGKDAGVIAAAVYFPTMLQIEVNTDAAFGDHIKPSDVGDLTIRSQQFKFAKASGAIMHEAGHAKFTPDDLEGVMERLTENEYQAFMLLEETRMEKRMVRHLPHNRAFLRACALEIVFGDIEEAAKEMSGTRAAAHSAALSMARVDAGVLEKADIKKLDSKLRDVLGNDLVSKLRSLWKEFHGCVDPKRNLKDVEKMEEIAIKWNRIVQDAAEENGEGAEREGGKGHEGDGRDGNPSEIDEETMKKILEAFADAAKDAEIGAEIEAQGQRQQEQYEQEAKESKEQQRQRAESQKNSTKVFTNYMAPEASGSNSRLVEERSATHEERRAAHIVASELERAKYQDRIRIESDSELPPGRLRMRAVIQQDGMRQSNRFAKTEPFKQVKTRHAEDPELTMGVMVDISGSMGGAMEPMGVTAWVLAEAVRRIQGTLAMVYYGYGVFPTLKPGETQDRVRIYSAADGHEECGIAARALDGELDLTMGSGARLVVIVSDGQYRPNKEAGLVEMFDLWERAGVGVLWVGYGHSTSAKAHCDARSNMEYILPDASPSQVALQIGRAAAKALENASQMLNSRG